MNKLSKVIQYIFENRRVIGLIIGSTLTLAGLPEYGSFVTKVGES